MSERERADFYHHLPFNSTKESVSFSGTVRNHIFCKVIIWDDIWLLFLSANREKRHCIISKKKGYIYTVHHLAFFPPEPQLPLIMVKRGGVNGNVVRELKRKVLQLWDKESEREGAFGAWKASQTTKQFNALLSRRPLFANVGQMSHTLW